MKITRITAWRQDQPFRDGPYVCSGNRVALGFESTIVRIEADAGVTGWGEMSPLGSFYSPAFAAGARAGVTELAPKLIGLDPLPWRALEAKLEAEMMGQPYVKAAIDMALWDLRARAAEQPLAEYLGGRFGDGVDLYRSISQDTPDKMAVRAKKYLAEGYRRLQVKVGGDPRVDVARLAAVRDAVGPDVILFADANGGWTRAQARLFLHAVRDISFTMEQPCMAYEDCRAIRAHCAQPMVLDESIDTLSALVHAHADGVADGVTIKIARVGGVGKAARMRDLCVDLKLPVTVEDTGGAEIDTAAMAHLSLSTPAELRLHTVDFHNWVTIGHGTGLAPCRDGKMFAPTGHGLGIDVDLGALAQPFIDCRA
jgi:L-alanine-DL-glutamate epimerase-like enolase superfamily enzyme